MLQQFFLIPPLRQGILSCKLAQVEKGTALNDGKSVNSDPANCQDLLHQLQLLFGNLLLSERRSYDTRDLVASIQGYDGSSLRPGEQQDVDEFFGLFCDRLETALKLHPQRRLLQDIFGGRISHIITCQECGNSSERAEDSLAISLDVNGKKNILESLNLYVQSEHIQGYRCERCHSRQDSVKRCCIKSLPNTLILHLKRFEFDLDQFRKIKLNGHCEFPTELDLRPFTKENIIRTTSCGKTPPDSTDNSTEKPDSYYRYYLRGVLVHTGTADSGHYYSLVKGSFDGNRKRKDKDSSRTMEDLSWFCFNDSSVTPFDPTTLPEEAFGGSRSAEKFDQLPERDSYKPYSAYLLIYERKHIEFLNNGAKEDDTEPGWHAPYENLVHAHEAVPKIMREAICLDNDRFIQDQTFFDPAYSTWLLDVAKSIKKSNPPSLALTKVVTMHLVENLLHAKDRSVQVESFATILCSWFSQSSDACSWLLGAMCDKFQIWTEKVRVYI